MNYKSILKQIEDNIGKKPRRFNFIDKLTWLRLRKPEWDWHNDNITLTINDFHRTFEEGKLAWAHIIQANKLMFRPGNVNCPGELLVWVDGNIDFNVEDIEVMANVLFDLKGTSETITDPETKKFAEYLENEFIRNYGLKVPNKVSNGIDFRICTVFFQRHHIPNGVITNGLFPVLYLEENPMVVVIVPHRFWTQELLDVHQRLKKKLPKP